MRKDIDWSLVQQEHNAGATWDDLVKKFKLTTYLLSKANKKGLFVSRTISQSLLRAHFTGKYNYEKYRTKEFRRKMAQNGGIKEKAGRCHGEYYENIKQERFWLQGSWEKKVAQFLNFNSVIWVKNSRGFTYKFDKERLYYPDFYLPVEKMYVEVKGYKTDKDIAKWQQFPHRLIVLEKKEIMNLSLDLFRPLA